MKKRIGLLIMVLAMSMMLGACGGMAMSNQPTGDEADGGTSSSQSEAEIAVGTPATEYTNEEGVTFQIVKAEDVWSLSEKLSVLSSEEQRSEEMYIQMDMIVASNEIFMDHQGSASLAFRTYVLKDLADGTPRRLEIMGTLLSDASYGNETYAAGATLDEDAYTALYNQCSAFEGGERVTVRGKLTKAYFTDRFHLRKEDAYKYDTYLAIMEIEPKEVGAVHLGDVSFEKVEDLNDLWAACEMNEQYVVALPGYPTEHCYVELELEVPENVTVEESETATIIRFTSLEPEQLSDGTARKIDLKGVVYKHVEPMNRLQLVGAAVDDDTYEALVKKCSKLKGGEKVVVKGCLVTSYLEENIENTLTYDTSLAIIGLEVK